MRVTTPLSTAHLVVPMPSTGGAFRYQLKLVYLTIMAVFEQWSGTNCIWSQTFCVILYVYLIRKGLSRRFLV